MGNKLKSHLLMYRFLLPAWFAFLGLNLLFRLILSGLHSEIFAWETLWSLFYGLRMDTIIFSAFAVFFALFYALNGRLLLRLGFTALLVGALWFEIVAIVFFDQFASRPNYLIIEHAKNMSEIFLMLWGLYPVAIVVVVIALSAITAYLFKWLDCIEIEGEMGYRLLVLPLVVFILFVGMRSSFDDSTPNQSFYTFSKDNNRNEIANNTIFSILYAWHWAENEYFGNYGAMGEQEAVALLREQNHFDSQEQLLRLQKSLSSGKKNVILIMLESFGKDHVGYLGGTPTTPNLDKLASEGLAFTRMYGAGTRTSWGVSTLLSATYPVPGRGYVKSLKSQNNFYTIARSFKQHGYKNMFLYSGDADFDNMKAFMLSNGFDEVEGKEAFSSGYKKYTWGYDDEALFDKAEALIKAQDSPFFLTLMTLSSHEPFDYPQGKVELYLDAPVKGFANSIKYADFALGGFIQRLRDQGLMENTVIGLIADHANRVYGPEDVPVSRYQIAAVILDEKFKAGQRYDLVSSQIDFVPTLMDVAGLDVTLPGVGSSVLSNPRDSALMLYRLNYAYLTSDDLIIYKDGKAPKCYTPNYVSKSCVPEVVRAGLANILVPHYFYESGKHRLP